MQLTTPTYMTSFNVELVNPVLVADSVYTRDDSSIEYILENSGYTETQHTLGKYINYQMLMYANQYSYTISAESLPYRDVNNVSTFGFRVDDTEYLNMTVEQAVYFHFKTYVMTDHTLNDIDLGINSTNVV